ncbi:hypothetical protein DOTSEDRAFT_85706 [Dothistroma septosporum NZE10]|uniref:SMP-30/Gluconolactonase/LRE-like region domain-containing protein n=1 Tax=Dothistroma septosporum (strain NZE10 / CBS 128990) TaxID=675120 RepID=N1PY73_DOTSN|nr:hypothetical protein DOTSEDRAFT_85706 [Dothistroma septosporum NZE10]
MFYLVAATALLSIHKANSQSASRCPGHENNDNVACINRYASVLPLPFDRPSVTTGADPAEDNFIYTSVPSDPSFVLVKNSTFLLYDQQDLSLLGSSPRLEKIFETRNDSIHEAPVYVPGLNVIIFSLPHQGVYEQQMINLNNTPPTIENYTTTPPVYAVNGGKLYKNKIYWASEASSTFPVPHASEQVQQAPGIYRLDPYTNKTEVLLNNYFGTLFNSPNDLFIEHSTGDIFFTDSWYGYVINVTSKPVLSPATYRFRPSTGLVQIVENELGQPNGIGISPGGETMYISDTGITDFKNFTVDSIPRYSVNAFGGKIVYAYDLKESKGGSYLGNKRPIWQAQTFAVDGMHVSKEGFVLGAAGTGIDVLTECGALVMRIEVPGTINNFQFAGEHLDELWLFGPGGIFKVSGLEGLSGTGDE